MDKRMRQDWAFLKKYQEANLNHLSRKPTDKPVVFMGDSITEFWSTICPEFFDRKLYLNRGISGQTTPQMLIRFRQDAINLKPALVVILAGVNDIAGNTGPSSIEMITDNIFSMAELAKIHKIKVALCSVLPANSFNWNPRVNPADSIIELNIRIKTYATQNDLIYVDYHSMMVNENKGIKTNYSDDGAHPNKNGYEIMAPIIEHSIKLALGSN